MVTDVRQDVDLVVDVVVLHVVVDAGEDKDVRQLVTAERHLRPKCTNFGFFITKVYKFWVFYYQNVRILDLFMKLYEYWDVT